MFDAGVVDAGVVAIEAVESLLLSVVSCPLLLQEVTENNSTPASEVQKVLAEIIFVVLRINKCRAEEVYKGYVEVNYDLSCTISQLFFALTCNLRRAADVDGEY
jgi:hypothetical protein